MEKIDRKFYDGFEGEPEIHFICKLNSQVKRLIVWVGYFNEIMYLIEPVEGKWTSLAYYYHLHIGWYSKEGPWRVEKPEEALAQFRTIDKTLLEAETLQVFEEICTLIEYGIEKEGEIFIKED